MTPAKRLAPILSFSLLTACGGFVGGGVPTEPQRRLPADAARLCAAPASFFPASGAMTRAQVEIAAGRMGDELLRCRAEKAALAAWGAAVISDLGAGR